MTRRREVRVAEAFFAELDDRLCAERGPHGKPSATDFIVVDLPEIVEQFAAAFDDLPEATSGVLAIRMFIGSGTLVAAFVVHGVETTEGVVHLVGIEIEL